jgi:hypothetical protein
MELSDALSRGDTAEEIEKHGRVGIVETKTVPMHVAQDAVNDATYMCDRHYGFAPEVVFLGSNLEREMPYLASHLYYIMFELVKYVHVDIVGRPTVVPGTSSTAGAGLASAGSPRPLHCTTTCCTAAIALLPRTHPPLRLLIPHTGTRFGPLWSSTRGGWVMPSTSTRTSRL